MTAKELMQELIGAENLGKPTVDTCKHGDPNRTVKKVGICMTATPRVLQQAKEACVDLLITHEPTFHDHFENPRSDTVCLRKRDLVAECDFTLYRFHDFIHNALDFDHINEGFLRKLCWKGKYDGRRGFVLEEPTTVRELALQVRDRLGIRHPRIIGDPELQVTKLNILLGAGGCEAAEQFLDDGTELMITGEICEWHDGEPVRDAGQMGIRKAMLVLGHAACEAPGMEVFAADLSAKHPELEVVYFTGGDLFSYVD